MTDAEQISSLGDKAAIGALSRVASLWLAQRTAEATSCLFLATAGEGAPSRIPGWALDPQESEADAGASSRIALIAILEGTDDEAAAWARASIQETSQGMAHVVDPVSLGIMGGILIGAILAARVKRIGKVEFFEGVPKELAEVVKAGAGFAGPA